MTRTLLTHTSPNLLRRLAREHLLEQPTLTIVPNLAAGRSLRQFTRQALPTITFAQFARRQLADAGWQPLPTAERDARLRELLGQLNLTYFGPILDRPGTVTALWNVIRALLRADASRLPAGRSPRERDLSSLQRAWVLGLMRDGLYDPAVPEFFASRTAVRPHVLTVSGFAYLDAAQIAYLDRIAEDGSTLFLAAAFPAGLSEAQRTAQALTERGWSLETAQRAREANDPRARIGDRAARTVLSPDDGQQPECEVLTLPNAIEEAREALRQVKRAHQEHDRPWHELAIVIRDEATYLGPLVDAAARYGVPLVSQARRPLLHTPLGSLLTAWVEAGMTDWPFEATTAVLTHPLIAATLDVSARQRAFRRRTPRGLHPWQLGLHAASLEWPASASGAAYLQFMTAGLKAWGVLDRQRRDPVLGAALAALQLALSPLGTPHLQTRTAFLTALRAALTEAAVPVWPGKGGVRIATPLGTLGRSFQSVWILGLSEGGFPRPATDPPLLDAHLRAFWSQTGVYLPGGVESQAIEQALFFHALACARESLTLMRPEVAAGRRVAPSSFLRAFAPAQAPTDLHAGSLTESRVHHAALSQLHEPAVQAAAAREFNRERGLDGGPLLPGLINPDTWTWSPSQLHEFGSCRYRWFAHKGLGLYALPVPRQGFGPLGQGSLYHLALERVLTPHVGNETPSTDTLIEQLPAALDDAARTLENEGAIDLGPLWHVERAEHLRALERAVRSPDFLPAGQQVQALEAQLDGTLRVDSMPWTFTGRADRIDDGPAGMTVTDYKLGSYVSLVQDSTGSLNTEIQLAVYLALTGAAQGRYFSLKKAQVIEGTGPSWPSEPGAWDAQLRRVQAFLSDVRASMQRGDFRARPDTAMRACEYCDVRPVCRFQAFNLEERA